MKIRTDFVTNSSSSSFVIGQINEKLTCDDVFEMLKSLYQECEEKRNELKLVDKSFGFSLTDTSIIYYDTDGTPLDKENPDYYKKILKVHDRVKKTYHISLDYYRDTFMYDWMQCKTYAEFEEYWRVKQEESKKLTPRPYIMAPFVIVDMSQNGNYYDLTYQNGFTEAETIEKLRDSVFGWYFPCECKTKEDMLKAQEEKPYCDWCSSCGEKCDKLKMLLENEASTEKTRVLHVMGKICIWSECGYIPYPVVEKLTELSNFSCNHMG